MKVSKFFAALFGLLGIGVGVMGIYLSFQNMNASPVLLEQPDAARERAAAVMDAVCAADYETVGSMLHGRPQLGIDRQAEEDVGVVIWEAFEASQSYELVGECYATDSGVALDVTFQCLDLDSVTATLKDRSQALLEQRVAEAEDTSEVYDENNDYREDFVMGVLYDAALQALEEDARQTTFTITLNLVHEDGQWWVVPDAALLDAISGGILS